MCRPFIIALLLIFGQRLLQAQTDEQALLWRISGNGLEKYSYLFGTVHTVCSDDFFLPQGTEKALAETEQLALELKTDDPMLLFRVGQGMMMPQGKHLKDLLSEADYERLNRFFKESVKTDLGMLGFMKPIALSSLLYPQLMNCSSQVSYELKLTEAARRQNKEIIGMETVEDQLKVFDAVPLDKQAQMLMEMLDKRDEQEAEMKALINAYKNQDIETLYARFKKSSFGTEEFEEILLSGRNRAWVEKIGRLSSEKPTFYAVGAGHLGGPNGLIALLRQTGFTVEPVR